MPHAFKVRMVKGPARVFVKGACHVLGRNVSGQTVKVRAGRALPFEPAGMCRLQARLGQGGRLWWADSRKAGTFMWRSLVEQVFLLTAANKKKNSTATTVMLVGDTDTGKSTLAIYLANMAIRRGLVPSVIDGDIGQGDLAPPTSIGAAILSTQVVDLRDVADVNNNNNTNLFEFIGSISPTGFESLIAKKMRSMLNRTSPLADICIVNTDGYIRDGGIQYKKMIAEELQPDVVICLGDDVDDNDHDDDDDDLFDGEEHLVGSWQILRARSSSQTYKTRLERLNHRLDQFLRYVGTGSSIANLSQVKFNYANSLFLSSDLIQPPIKQLELENMKDMFVGLGSNGIVTGFGVIKNVNLSNNNNTSSNSNSIHIQTNINSFDTIYLSNIRLSSYRIMEIWIT